MMDEKLNVHRTCQMTMEDLASTLSIQPEPRGAIGAVAEPNDSQNNSSNINPLSSSARARVSKVLKRLKKPKWRKRLSSSSKSASDALEAVSESDSVCSGADSSLTSTRSESFDNGSANHENLKKNTRTTFFSDNEEYDVEVDVNHHRRQASASKSSSIVFHESSRSTIRTSSSVGLNSSGGHQTLPDSFDVWVSTAHDLLRSREMNAFVHSTNRVITSALQTSLGATLSVSGMMVQTAFLPVTLPLHVAASTTDLMINVAGAVLNTVLGENHDDNEAQPGGTSNYHTPAQDLIGSVINFVPFLFETAVHVITPALGNAIEDGRQNRHSPQQSAASTKEGSTKKSTVLATTDKVLGDRSLDNGEDVLQRLRLDIFLPTEGGVPEEDDAGTIRSSTTTDSKGSTHESPSGATESDISKYLLRVDDIHLVAPPNPVVPDRDMRAVYVDLGKEFGDEALTKNALAKLLDRGLVIATSNSAVDIVLPKPHDVIMSRNGVNIEWKPQGQTKKDYKRLSQVPQNEFFKHLRSHVLIWSGKYSGPKYHGSDNPLFMARGVVKGSPHQFASMLWDSSRTTEYNNYCLGRKDVIVMNDEFTNGGLHGAKVIKSETKVPFTNMSVFLTVLMHAKALGVTPDEGFVIFSRSLDTGRAGCHVRMSNNVDRGDKNEIIVGVNIMKPVPDHPELTDLISVSQVNASMVPPFLAFRIGMMGVEDFFKNVR